MKSYKGYSPTIWHEADDRSFHGIVDGIRDTIHFTGRSADELEQAFQDSVDDYLQWAEEAAFTPDRPYSGKFAFRTTPEHHRMIAEAAAADAKSINQYMEDVLVEVARRRAEDGSRKVKLR
ncbi:MAG: type II toxin-antitoxin system HicB family antitoxin [Jannaschia sp.]